MQLVTSTQPPNSQCLNDDDASEARHSRTRPNLTGHTLADRYLLTRKIGEGGMGEVYEARHQALGRRVAIKLLHDSLPQRDSHLARFSREAMTLASLSSEHIVAVTDFDETDDGLPFMVMEYLEGEDLRKLLKRYSILPVQRAVQLVADACEGVKVAHARGLVHRDIKPENLFVCSRPSGKECCKVLDFGVAKQSDASTLTRDGALIGTVRYMAPEQALGKKDIDGRVDVFALGSILYECLCGEPAFDGDRPETILFAIIHREPTPLRELNPDIPRGLESIVARALARDPDNRYSTIAEFADALATFLRHAEGAPAGRSVPTAADASAARAEAPSNDDGTTWGGTFGSTLGHFSALTQSVATERTRPWSRLGFVGALVASACLGAVVTTAAGAGWSKDYDLQAISDSLASEPTTTHGKGDGASASVDPQVATPEAAPPAPEQEFPRQHRMPASMATATRPALIVPRAHKPGSLAPSAAPTAAQTHGPAESPAVGPNAELSLDLAPNPYR